MRGFIAGFLLVFALSMGVEQAKADVTAGLVGGWNLDGNGNDSSGLNHQGTVHGATATTDRFGYANEALMFNGIDTYVSVPDRSDLRPSSAITFTGWFNSTSFNLGQYSWPAVLKKQTYPNVGDGYGMEAGGMYQRTPMMTAYVTLPSTTLQAYLPITTNTWYFGAGVYDGSSLSFYLGQWPSLPPLTVTSQSGSGAINNSLGELQIGADPANPGSARSFNGAIDDVRIYNRALTPSEVDVVYHSSDSPEPFTLILLGMGAIGLLAYVWRRRKRTA